MIEILTPSQTSGPFFAMSMMRGENLGHAVRPDSPGALRVQGLVTDGDNHPIPRQILIEFWWGEMFARTQTTDAGRFSVVVAKPPATSLPDGRPLAPYLNVHVFGRALNHHLYTRLYFPDENEVNARDAILAVVPVERRGTLIARPGNEPDSLHFDIHLQGGGETVFFDY